MQKINNYLQTLDLSEGSSVRTTCPKCNSYNTFTVTKSDGILLYNCYKLSCDATGMKNVGLTAHEIKARLDRVAEDKTVREQLDPMVWPEYVVQPSAEHTLFMRFIKRWELELEDMMYDVKDRRAVFPIRERGVLIDAAGRSLDGATPKWYRYSGRASVFTSVKGRPSGVVVVVEDIISAITVSKLGAGLTGMAILGTSLGTRHIEKLEDYYRVIVALDPDAVNKTLQYKREIQAWTGLSTRALLLEDDLKYKRSKDLINLENMI